MIIHTKSYPEPDALTAARNASSKDYRIPEVIIQLESDFKNKCYLCETKRPTTINIEHFHPHRGDLNLMLSWDNLYYACGHCNNLKLDQYDDILNCLVPEDDLENKIQLKMDPYPRKDVEVIPMTQDSRTLKTSELLKKIYNGSTTIKTVEASNIKTALLYELMKFQKQLVEYYEYEDNLQEREAAEREIRRHLSSDSAYTGFKRWIIKQDGEYISKFGQYFNND